jgi:hypothetical protein
VQAFVSVRVRYVLSGDAPSGPAPPNGLSRAWSGLFQIAGAVAGIGALIYLVGAVTLWLRFESAGFPADAAIAHEPRSQVVALGVRGLVGVGSVWLIVLLAVAYLLSYGVARRKGETRDRHMIDFVGEGIKGWGPQQLRWFGLLACGLVLAASATDWRVLGIVVFIVIFIGGGLFYLRARANQQASGVPLALIISYVLAAGALGAAWQVTSASPVTQVVVRPQFAGLPRNFPIPYFGEDSNFVYLGKIVRITHSSSRSPNDWTYCHRVIEVDRSKVKLIFVSGAGRFGHGLKTPIRGLFDLLKGRSLASVNPDDPACYS